MQPWWNMSDVFFDFCEDRIILVGLLIRMSLAAGKSLELEFRQGSGSASVGMPNQARVSYNCVTNQQT